MSGFGYGAQNTTANTGTTFSFGSSPATTSTGISFGTPTAGTTTGFQFNSPAQTSGGLSFGTPQTTAPPPSGFSFGSNQQSPGGLTFGTPQTTATAVPAFKTTTAAVGGLGLGNVQQTTPSFGSTPQTTQSFGSSTPLTFGSAPQTTALSFGTPAAAATGLTFGSLTTTSTATPQSTLTFSASTQPTTGLSFGAAPTAAVTTTTTAAAVTGGLSFGSTTTTAVVKPTLSFGISTSAGTPTAATTAPSSGLFNFSAPKTTSATGFSLTSATAGTSLFSTTTATTTATTSTTITTPFKGLGGVDTTQSLTGVPGGSSGRSDIKSVKENLVENETMQTIDTFKNFVKQQKNLGCEVTRTSGKPMNKVTEDTDSLKQILTAVHSALQKNRQMSNKLKADTTKCLLLCEMAQHTHDTPSGLQNENIAPLEFFLQLASKFEKDVTDLRMEIDNTEKHVNSLSQPALLTPQELSVALRRLHDSFVALAGQLQTAHAAVAIQKERHLNLRRHFLKDGSNIFEPDNKSSTFMRSFQMPMTLSPGPTPFSSMGNTHSVNMLSSQDTSGPTFPGISTISGWGTAPAPPSGNSLLQTPGNTSLFSPQPVENQNFQLLKPPPGNKRGKR